MIGSEYVSVLRDSGCSGVVDKKKIVNKEQYLGRDSFMMMIDKSIKKVPIARIVIDTPYYSGEVEALCLSDVIYDLVIGNIPDARPPNDLNLL